MVKKDYLIDPADPDFRNARVFALMGLVIWFGIMLLILPSVSKKPSHFNDIFWDIGIIGGFIAHLVLTIAFVFRRPWAAWGLFIESIPALAILLWGIFELCRNFSMLGAALVIISLLLLVQYMESLFVCYQTVKKSNQPVCGFEPIMKAKEEKNEE